MDKLIKQFLDSSTLGQWLHGNNFGWLISERIINTVSIIIGSVFVYFLGKYLLSWTIHYSIRSTAKHRSWHRKDIEKREKTLIQLTRSFWQIIIIFYVAAIVANKLFLFDLSPLFASAGIIGVALGFGAQSLVKDFLSGIFIIAENQYRVGDVVDVMGAAGTVERVGTRTTVIRDSEGNVHYVPMVRSSTLSIKLWAIACRASAFISTQVLTFLQLQTSLTLLVKNWLKKRLGKRKLSIRLNSFPLVILLDEEQN